MNIKRYMDTLRGKRVAVIGVGVSNTPLIRLLLDNGIDVTACDKNERDKFGPLADELEAMGARLRLGPKYLEDLDQDVIFKTPGLRPDIPELMAARERGSVVRSSSRSARAGS